jgi:hypothetical protein
MTNVIVPWRFLVRLFFEERLIDYDDGTLERDKQKVPNLEVYSCANNSRTHSTGSEEKGF